MSIVIAYKHDGLITFGADTQTSFSENKMNITNQERLKIKLIGTDFILAGVGKVRATLILSLHPEWFNLPTSEVLTKQYVVEKIVNPYFKNLADEKHELETTPSGTNEFPASFLVGRGDRLFEIMNCGGVVEIEDVCAIGSGSDFALPCLRDPKQIQPQDRILAALRIASRFDKYVSGPFVMMDTKDRIPSVYE